MHDINLQLIHMDNCVSFPHFSLLRTQYLGIKDIMQYIILLRSNIGLVNWVLLLIASCRWLKDKPLMITLLILVLLLFLFSILDCLLAREGEQKTFIIWGNIYLCRNQCSVMEFSYNITSNAFCALMHFKRISSATYQKFHFPYPTVFPKRYLIILLKN